MYHTCIIYLETIWKYNKYLIRISLELILILYIFLYILYLFYIKNILYIILHILYKIYFKLYYSRRRNKNYISKLKFSNNLDKNLDIN